MWMWWFLAQLEEWRVQDHWQNHSACEGEHFLLLLYWWRMVLCVCAQWGERLLCGRFVHHVCSCWSELLTVPDKTLVVVYMHTPCLTPHCWQSHFVIPDTVSTVMWVTVGGVTWEHGGGAATIPVVPEALEREGVWQKVLQLRRERVLCWKSVRFVHALLTSFKFVTMRAVNWL